MVSWKEWFERIDKELDLTKKKKRALDDLYNAGKISQYTYEYLDKEVTEEIAEFEARRKALTEKMTQKLNLLEEQLKTIEIFLVRSEMAYAAEEINEEVHAAESNALSLGIEATKQELNMLREVIIQLVPEEKVTAPITAPTPTPVETAELTLKEPVIEKQPEATLIEAPSTAVSMPSEPTTTTETPSQGGNAPFQSESENPTAQEENKEGQG